MNAREPRPVEGNTDAMVPPFIALVDGDLEIYATRLHAEGHIESPEVDDGLVRAWDCAGRRLAFEVLRAPGQPAPPPRTGRWGWVDILPIRLHPLEERPEHVDELREALIAWLSSAFGESPDAVTSLTPRELIARVAAKQGIRGAPR